MPHPQFIESPGGEQMVVLPRKEYEELCEAAGDTADVLAFDEAKRRLAAGEDELIPAAFADRILDGENPVRVWRRQCQGSGRSGLAISLSILPGNGRSRIGKARPS